MNKYDYSNKKNFTVELLFIAFIFLINEIFFSKIKYSSQVAEVVSLILITYFLGRRRSNWKEVGLRWPSNWFKAIGLFILCVVTIGVTFNFVIQPLFPQGANTISQGAISLNEMLLQLFIIGIGTAAIGEEMLFRGFVLNNLNELLGKNFIGTASAVIVQAFLFAILHSGVQGMVSAGVIGIILGIFYLWSERNLLVVISAHAVPDILSIIQSYQGS